ncbi:hypothetical protein DCS_02867 [Drechmeria coniospora]|uniref:MARVEL domain-containing protein n=1 Tax=Drechmeria coniospora TaxID=98403 RepID=A0A151GX92_DRECN|nr:hypothetical protein DCS_02867 [Drechmeria coniospora]KYK61724.1 hypothetical protein DCS_02867 [Drechmeria coniospora]ODA82526.1 hypothetical protein RJ55_01033 [Drechmeria coniospora]
MGRTTTVSLRILQGLLAAINMSLSAFVINYYLTSTLQGSPGSFSFVLAASCISFASLLYLELAPKMFPRVAHPYAILLVEATNTLFYFIAFIVLAVFLGSLQMCFGAVCKAGRADSVAAAAAFCAWIASTIFTAKDMFLGKLPRPGSKANLVSDV